jgi:bis(5'-nucleosidyl)-tetraphosphatase
MKRTEKKRCEESVGVVLTYRPSSSFISSTNSEQFLLLKSPKGDWNFVKGHREKEETDYETLKREILEETGITKYNIQSYLDKIKYKFMKNGVEVEKEVKFYYATTATSNILLSEEHIDFIWLRYEQAKRLLVFYESKRILEKVFASGLSY